MKAENLYLVKNSCGQELHIYASSNAQAKRRYCREYGLRPSDPWTGVADLAARKLSPDEAAAWEAQAGDRRALGIFLEGMLEIACKVGEDSRREQCQLPGTQSPCLD